MKKSKLKLKQNKDCNLNFITFTVRKDVFKAEGLMGKEEKRNFPRISKAATVCECSSEPQLYTQHSTEVYGSLQTWVGTLRA